VENLEAAPANHEVVVSADELDSTHFNDAQSTALRAVLDCQLFQQHYAVRDRMQLQIVASRSEVIQQNDRAAPTSEKVLERQHLPPVTKRALREQPQLRKAVEHYPRRVQLFDSVENQLSRFAQLHFGRMQHRELTLRVQRGFRRYEFENVDAVERPAVPLGDQPQFLHGFRQ
jgi:hypothetical protein